MSLPPVARQFLRFALVGVANTVTTLAVLWLLRERAGLPVWLASAIGYALGVVQSYLVNRAWTFAGARPGGRRFARFVVLNIGVGCLFSALTALLTVPLGLRLASIAALVPVTVASFAGARFWVFRTAEGQKRSARG